MSDVHGFGDIWPTKVEDIGLGLCKVKDAKPWIVANVIGDLLQIGIGNRDVDKAGASKREFAEALIVLYPIDDLFRDGAWCLLGNLGGSKRAIALELCQIRAIRNLDRTKVARQSLRLKGCGHNFGQCICQGLHQCFAIVVAPFGLTLGSGSTSIGQKSADFLVGGNV